MINKIKELASDSLIYGLGSMLLRFTQVLILPLIFIYLKKDEFGQLDYFLNIKNIIIIIYGWGIITAVFKYIDNTQEKCDTPFSGLLIIAFISFIVFCVFYTLSLFFESWKANYSNFILTHIIAFFGAMLTVPLGVLRQQQKPYKYILVNTLYTAIFLSVSYTLLKTTELNYRAILVSHIIASILSFFYGLFSIRNNIIWKFNWHKFKLMLNFGFSILLNALTFVLILGFTRFFLKSAGTFSEIGILGMSLRLSLVVGSILVAPFTLAWLPFVRKNSENPEFRNIVNIVFRVFSWLGLLMCLSLAVTVKDVFTLFINNKEYHEASYYVLPFALSYFFQGIYYVFSAGIFISGNTRQYKLIAAIGLISNLILYLVFFKQLNIVVISYITLFTFFIITGVATFFGNKTLKIKIFNTANIIIYFTYFILFSLFQFTDFFTTSSSAKGFIIKCIVLLVLFITHVAIEIKIKNRHDSNSVSTR